MSTDLESAVVDTGVVEETVGAVGPLVEHLHMFNRSEFNGLNTWQPRTYERVDAHDGDRLIGSFVGMRMGDEVGAGWSAPFGGPDFCRPAETITNIFATIDGALEQFDADGVRTIRVKAKPLFYSGNEQMIQHVLYNRGFSVEACDLSYHIDVENLHSRDDYLAALKSPARRALKHSFNEPYEFGELHTHDEWRIAHDIILHNRAAKGRSVNLSLDYIWSLHETFGDKIRYFGLSHNGRMIGSALLYRVQNDIELVEYWGDAFHELPRSPMNVLAYHVICWSIEQGRRIVDLGLSSVNGEPNQGLIQFKQSILARPELRLNFVRHHEG
jgi:Peptidogalycan biosysnthesis/recognition